MRPQLEAEDYPPDQIGPRIQQEWQSLSKDVLELWRTRYKDPRYFYREVKRLWKLELKRLDHGDDVLPDSSSESEIYDPSDDDSETEPRS